MNELKLSEFPLYFHSPCSIKFHSLGDTYIDMNFTVVKYKIDVMQLVFKCPLIRHKVSAPKNSMFLNLDFSTFRPISIGK